IGTWATPYLIAFGRKPFEVWDTSNVLKGAIVEVPMFSFFMGTLHAYFITLPVTIVTASALVIVFCRQEQKKYVLPAIVGALVGFHDGLHTWSLPPLICLVAVLWCFSPRRHRNLGTLGILSVTALIVAAPYAWHHHGAQTGIKWVPAE